MGRITRTLFKLLSPPTQRELTMKRRFAIWRAKGRIDLNDLMKLALDALDCYSQVAVDHLVARDYLHDSAICQLAYALVDVEKQEHGSWQEEIDLGRGPIKVEKFGRVYPRRERAQMILRKLLEVSAGERRDKIIKLLQEAPQTRFGYRFPIS